MKIFVSWSRDSSRRIAVALKKWMAFVFPTADVFVSSQSIEPGERWFIRISEELDHCDFGFVCLTPENLTSSWLLFESGALAKRLGTGRVIPLLFDVDMVEVRDLNKVLNHFQGISFRSGEASLESIAQLIRAVTAAFNQGTAPDDTVIQTMAQKWEDEFGLVMRESSPRETFSRHEMNCRVIYRYDSDLFMAAVLKSLARCKQASLCSRGCMPYNERPQFKKLFKERLKSNDFSCKFILEDPLEGADAGSPDALKLGERIRELLRLSKSESTEAVLEIQLEKHDNFNYLMYQFDNEVYLVPYSHNERHEEDATYESPVFYFRLDDGDSPNEFVTKEFKLMWQRAVEGGRIAKFSFDGDHATEPTDATERSTAG